MKCLRTVQSFIKTLPIRKLLKCKAYPVCVHVYLEHNEPVSAHSTQFSTNGINTYNI